MEITVLNAQVKSYKRIANWPTLSLLLRNKWTHQEFTKEFFSSDSDKEDPKQGVVWLHGTIRLGIAQAENVPLHRHLNCHNPCTMAIDSAVGLLGNKRFAHAYVTMELGPARRYVNKIYSDLDSPEYQQNTFEQKTSKVLLSTQRVTFSLQGLCHLHHWFLCLIPSRQNLHNLKQHLNQEYMLPSNEELGLCSSAKHLCLAFLVFWK